MERREQIKDREREAWRLRLLGYTQMRIAEELGVEQPCISKALSRIEKRLAEQFAAEALEMKARQTAQLEALYESLLDQWRRSCETSQKVSITSGRLKVSEEGAQALPDLVVTVTEAQSGNPALLSAAMKALADVRDIWGLNAASRTELTGANQGPVRITEVRVEMLTAEIQQKLARLAGEDGDPEPTQ